MNNELKEEKLPAFPNKHIVLLHLQDAGYQLSRAKFYRDCKKGAVRVNRDGSVLESEVRAYASTLNRVQGNIDDLSDLISLKNKKELEKLDEQVQKLKFEREKEEGKYIERAKFEAELAARAIIFESGFRHAFNMYSREWVALVGGKIEKSGELLEALNQMLDQQLSSYASISSFQVMFTNEEGGL